MLTDAGSGRKASLSPVPYMHLSVRSKRHRGGDDNANLPLPHQCFFPWPHAHCRLRRWRTLGTLRTELIKGHTCPKAHGQDPPKPPSGG